MIKRKQQSQFAGEIFSGVADALTVNGRCQPFAIVIGLLAAFEHYAKGFIATGAEQFGEAGRIAAIHAIRAGLESITHTLDQIEKNVPPPVPSVPSTPPNTSVN